MMNLNEWRDEVHKNAVEHGWWEEVRSFGDVVSLMHSELSEAIEECRAGHGLNEVYTKCDMEEHKARGSAGCGVCKYCAANKPEGIPVELVDCIIRILDFMGKENIDVEEVLRMKHEFNKNRPYRHGGKKI